jgi:hypothetical protein
VSTKQLLLLLLLLQCCNECAWLNCAFGHWHFTLRGSMCSELVAQQCVHMYVRSQHCIAGNRVLAGVHNRLGLQLIMYRSSSKMLCQSHELVGRHHVCIVVDLLHSAQL